MSTVPVSSIHEESCQTRLSISLLVSPYFFEHLHKNVAVKWIPHTINYDYTGVVFSFVRFLSGSEKWGSFVTTQTRWAARGKRRLRNIPPRGFCWGMVRVGKTADVRKKRRCVSVRSVVQKKVHWPGQVGNSVTDSEICKLARCLFSGYYNEIYRHGLSGIGMERF